LVRCLADCYPYFTLPALGGKHLGKVAKKTGGVAIFAQSNAGETLAGRLLAITTGCNSVSEMMTDGEQGLLPSDPANVSLLAE